MRKKIIILATGGTIAGTGIEGKSSGYKPGTLTAEDLINSVPQILDIADIEAVQVCNENSDDITSEIWLELADIINSTSKRPEVCGFVITHGTDTLEETAYFLNLTVKTEKPVVLTGSMRPATSISADGPMNLYEAMCLAASEKAVGLGVLAVFSDKIFSARSVKKISTYDLEAVSAGEFGTLGIIRDGEIYFYEKTLRLHTINTEFEISGLKNLPKVSIIYFAVDADSEILKFAAERSDGLVIAGAGAGEFSKIYKSAVEKLKIPVVISSRTNEGIIISSNLLCKNTIAADNLSPQKAAVLLRLALTKTHDIETIRKMFSIY